MAAVTSINRENLRIARENMGLSTSDASKRISASKKDLVAAWESGESLPSWVQVSKLARLYNVAELLFFSNEPLRKNKQIPDYRVGVDAESDDNVKKLVNLVATRQKWLERYMSEEGFEKNKLLGTGQRITDPKKLAELISRSLGIELEKIKSISGRKNTLNYLIGKAEEKGVFVGKTVAHHRLEVEDLRGLFMSNDYAPFIVLNRRDSLSAQIFSFIHELAHFFRKSDAISNSLEFRSTERNVNSEEVFCNKVAAELLLPDGEFPNAFYGKNDIDSISETYKVSPLFIFYRLKELGKIRRDIQDDLEREIQAEMERNLALKAIEEETANGQGNYTYAMRDSNGTLFNRTVSRSYLENKIGYVEASNLLRFSPEKV